MHADLNLPGWTGDAHHKTKHPAGIATKAQPLLVAGTLDHLQMEIRPRQRNLPHRVAGTQAGQPQMPLPSLTRSSGHAPLSETTPTLLNLTSGRGLSSLIPPQRLTHSLRMTSGPPPHLLGLADLVREANVQAGSSQTSEGQAGEARQPTDAAGNGSFDDALSTDDFRSLPPSSTQATPETAATSSGNEGSGLALAG